MVEINLVDAQDDDTELINALEASQRSTEAASDKDAEDNEDDTKTKDEDATTEGEADAAGEAGKKGDEKTDEEKAAEAEANTKAEADAAAIADAHEVKSMLRQVTQQNEVLEARVARQEKSASDLAAKKLKEENDADDTGEVKNPDEIVLSDIEILQKDITTIQQNRGESFNLMLEIMENNEATKDVKAVCSQANFDDIIEVIAEDVAVKEGLGKTEAFLSVAKTVWKQPNPFRYMYKLVKQYHPTYADATAAAAVKDKEEKDKKAAAGTKAGKTAEEILAGAPGSVADMGGGGANKTGWTSERIAALPEDKLKDVPKDIYEKYMEDELD